MQRQVVRGGLALALNLDSWCIMAIMTGMGMPHLRYEACALLYHARFSLKISHMLSGYLVACWAPEQPDKCMITINNTQMTNERMCLYLQSFTSMWSEISIILSV